MKIYDIKKSNKQNSSNVPNMFAFTFIRSFLTGKQYEQERKEYLLNNLNKNQVNQLMTDIKWMFKNYVGLDVVTIERQDGTSTKFIL